MSMPSDSLNIMGKEDPHTAPQKSLSMPQRSFVKHFPPRQFPVEPNFPNRAAEEESSEEYPAGFLQSSNRLPSWLTYPVTLWNRLRGKQHPIVAESLPNLQKILTALHENILAYIGHPPWYSPAGNEDKGKISEPSDETFVHMAGMILQGLQSKLYDFSTVGKETMLAFLRICITTDYPFKLFFNSLKKRIHINGEYDGDTEDVKKMRLAIERAIVIWEQVGNVDGEERLRCPRMIVQQHVMTSSEILQLTNSLDDLTETWNPGKLPGITHNAFADSDWCNGVATIVEREVKRQQNATQLKQSSWGKRTLTRAYTALATRVTRLTVPYIAPTIPEGVWLYEFVVTRVSAKVCNKKIKAAELAGVAGIKEEDLKAFSSSVITVPSSEIIHAIEQQSADEEFPNELEKYMAMCIDRQKSQVTHL
eukprot:GHVQ01009840.1.p1 GENE.GHVQ01009840.1~~GHVQ01009840.1.p1  ORF type:complete len:430 (-),score=46.09 GHVQ01009840.1:656-1921(-)